MFPRRPWSASLLLELRTPPRVFVDALSAAADYQTHFGCDLCASYRCRHLSRIVSNFKDIESIRYSQPPSKLHSIYVSSISSPTNDVRIPENALLQTTLEKVSLMQNPMMLVATCLMSFSHCSNSRLRWLTSSCFWVFRSVGSFVK